MLLVVDVVAFPIVDRTPTIVSTTNNLLANIIIVLSYSVCHRVHSLRRLFDTKIIRPIFPACNISTTTNNNYPIMKFSLALLVLSVPTASAFAPCTCLNAMQQSYIGGLQQLCPPEFFSRNAIFTSSLLVLIFFLLCAINYTTASRRSAATASSSRTQLHAELPRVVVTGMGITSCLGNTLEDVTKSLHDCKPGITHADEFEKLGIKSQVYGRPALEEDDFKELIPKSVLRFCGTNAKYAYIAMDRAIQDAGLKPEDYEENPRVASIIGQGGTSIPDIVETVEAVQAGGKRWKNKVGPFRVTRSMGSTCSAVLATAFKTQGPSYSISSACSTGAHCIGTGFEQIQLGKADIAFCGAGT